MVTKVSLFPFPMPAQPWKELSTRFFKIKRLTTTTIDWNNSINQNHQPSKNRIQYQIKNIKSNTWSRSYKIIIPIQNRGFIWIPSSTCYTWLLTGIPILAWFQILRVPIIKWLWILINWTIYLFRNFPPPTLQWPKWCLGASFTQIVATYFVLRSKVKYARKVFSSERNWVITKVLQTKRAWSFSHDLKALKCWMIWTFANNWRTTN